MGTRTCIKMTKNGCAFGQVSRTMIEDMRTDIKEIKSGIEGLGTKQVELFNHQSNRLPLWATILFTLLSSLVVGLIVLSLK